MVEPDDIQKKSRRLSRLLARKFGATGEGLRARRKRVGRLLPRNIREAVYEIERAENMIGHPKVAMQLNGPQIEQAYQTAYAHLDAVDPNDRIKGYVLGVLGVNAFNLVVIAGLGIVVAKWQGWV